MPDWGTKYHDKSYPKPAEKKQPAPVQSPPAPPVNIPGTGGAAQVGRAIINRKKQIDDLMKD